MAAVAAQGGSVVSAQWLAEALRKPAAGSELRILDASWYLPSMERDAKAEFAETHIPGASFFDLDECRDRGSPYGHMLPTEADFSAYAGALAISNNTHVVVYDASSLGAFSAPRVWWMFRVFGHHRVSLLDGGFKQWLADGHPVSGQLAAPERMDFRAQLRQDWVKSYEEMRDNCSSGAVQVVDARPVGRFRGTEPEPTDGVLPGHFAGTINMPFTSFLDASGKLLGAAALRELFREAGVKLERPLWVSCSLGVTACHVALAAHVLGHPGAAIYDGSWSEWFLRSSPENIITEGEVKKM